MRTTAQHYPFQQSKLIYFSDKRYVDGRWNTKNVNEIWNMNELFYMKDVWMKCGCLEYISLSWCIDQVHSDKTDEG